MVLVESSVNSCKCGSFALKEKFLAQATQISSAPIAGTLQGRALSVAAGVQRAPAGALIQL